MKIKNLTKLWVSRPTSTKTDGESNTTWTFLKVIYLNLQQDLNELDRNSAGEIDYSIYKGRTTIDYGILKGDGISLTDISSSNDIKPDFIINASPKIGKTITYTLKSNGG